MMQNGGMEPPGGAFKINVVPRGAWQSPEGTVFSTPGKVFADNRFPYLDHLKTVLQLQKQAFLTEMCVEEKYSRPPYALGLDEETYFFVVELPCLFMILFILLVLCTMASRLRQGKSALPFGVSCYEGLEGGDGGPGGDTGVDAGAGSAGAGPGGAEGSAAAGGAKEKKELPYERIPTPGVTPYMWSPPPSIFQPSPSPDGSGGGPSAAGGGSATKTGGTSAASGKKEKTDIPYERIPTPGAQPYVWSPPPSMFKPSPTPPGTPFMGSPGGATGADDSVGDEYLRQIDSYNLLNNSNTPNSVSTMMGGSFSYGTRGSTNEYNQTQGSNFNSDERFYYYDRR